MSKISVTAPVLATFLFATPVLAAEQNLDPFTLKDNTSKELCGKAGDIEPFLASQGYKDLSLAKGTGSIAYIISINPTAKRFVVLEVKVNTEDFEKSDVCTVAAGKDLQLDPDNYAAILGSLVGSKT